MDTIIRELCLLLREHHVPQFLSALASALAKNYTGCSDNDIRDNIILELIKVNPISGCVEHGLLCSACL